MLREASAVHELDWCEKTMSVLREKQYEACERRLSAYPPYGLFSPMATDAQAQVFWERSFYHSEAGNASLITLAALRHKVLAQLPTEALYLSSGESALLERLLISEGRVVSQNWDEIDAAEALTRRLWCSFVSEGENWALELPEVLWEPLLKAYHDPQYRKARSRLFRFDATIHGLLYIAGFLHAGQPRAFFLRDVMENTDALAQTIANRYMKASFEYIAEAEGDMVLVHPGLADPGWLMANLRWGGEITLTLNEDTLAGGMNGTLPEEEPLHEAMRVALDDHMRPEWEAEEAAEDLRLLAKQGVTLPAMGEVLDSMICVRRTAAMQSALQRLYDSTPHWVGMTANLQH